MSAVANIDELITTVESLSTSHVKDELSNLRAIAQWAFDQQGIKVGDRVKIAKLIDTNNGWRPYKEALAVGAKATVKNVRFSSYYKYWCAEIVLDEEWVVSDWYDGTITRWWHGRYEDTPEGYEPPSDYYRENFPEGRKHTFAIEIGYLKVIKPKKKDEE